MPPIQFIVIKLTISVIANISIFLLPVNALQCYQCLSKQSWSDCDSKRISVTCPIGLNRCAKIYVEAANEAFGRGCERSSVCSTYCSNPLFSKCKINCCTGNKCNGVGHLISGITTIAVALLAVMKSLL